MSSDFDIVVAGGGIAGLSAGLAAARLGRKTLVLTGDVLGGNLLSIEKIEGYPGFPEGVPGYELCPMAQAQAAEAGAEFASTTLQRLEGQGPEFHLVTGDGELSARAVIVATGSDIKALGVPGEERLKGKGVSHCASCDAPLLRGMVAAVVGGGDSAMQEALTLAGHASRVIVLHRGQALSGQASYRDRVLAHPSIEVRYSALVEEIVGEDAVAGARLRGTNEVVEAAGVFVYIGLAPNTAFLGGRLRLDGSRRIPTDAAMATEQAGLFAAGSVRSGWPGRAAASAGEGTAAAVAAHDYLDASK
jgi:thioredoxin reductase (NADPH)